MRTNLKVPFAEKDEAKKLGARWDAARKLWYVDGIADLSPFARWAPTPHDAAGGGSSAPRSSAAKKDDPNTCVVVGSKYVEQPRVCACLPWDECEKCRPAAGVV